MSPATAARELLYERLAGQLAQAIAEGSMAPGTRLPSVRQACATWGVSPATVFQAYSVLESRGLVETRARSGHYVADAGRRHPLPAAAAPDDRQARPVAVSELVVELLGSTRDADVVPLGSA